MALKDVFKVNRKTFLNPTAWIGYNELKNTNKTIRDTTKGLFTPAKAEHVETFEEAMVRLNLSEEDVSNNIKIFFRYAVSFVILAVLSFISSFYYLLHHRTVTGCLLAIAVSTFFLAQAFRYHFWYFQMKHRKLGCTYAEWRAGRVFSEEPNP